MRLLSLLAVLTGISKLLNRASPSAAIAVLPATSYGQLHTGYTTSHVRLRQQLSAVKSADIFHSICRSPREFADDTGDAKFNSNSDMKRFDRARPAGSR